MSSLVFHVFGAVFHQSMDQKFIVINKQTGEKKRGKECCKRFFYSLIVFEGK